MATWLANFANRPFRKYQRRLRATAAGHGIDHMAMYGMRDLKRDPFYHAHRDLFAYKLRVGNCLWKPLFIKRTLARMPDGDTLLWCDARVEIISSVQPLVALAESNGGIVPFVVHELLIGNWTKRDCLILLGCDSPRYYELEQANAAFIVFRKCPAAVQFVDEWLAACTDARTLTDDPNVMGKDDLPLFVAHRHDQAILALLLRKKGITHFRDPSQYGNEYLKPRPGIDESAWPWRNSTYPTLFNHHRRRTIEYTRLPVTAVKRLGEFIRGRYRAHVMFPHGAIKSTVQANRRVLAAVPRWLDDAVYANSIDKYGLSPQARPFLDLPLPRSLTFSDALVYLSTFLTRPVNYLELGAGVGKNFVQVLHGVRNASLTARDADGINPTLERMLVRQGEVEIPDLTPGMRNLPIRVTDYTFPANNNTVRYVTGDGMREVTWQPLVGKKYNIIFTNFRHAVHRQLFLHTMMKELDLIDGDEFIKVWDNLGSQEYIAFHGIAQDVRRRYRDVMVTTVPMRGMLGRHESHYRVGLMLKLPAYTRYLPARLLH